MSADPSPPPPPGGLDYRSSGVDIDEGERAVRLMREAVRSTFDSRVLSDLGTFGGLFRAEFPGVVRPVLVASTDGVGTKLRVAAMVGDYSTVGTDLVNHCVNDILVQGASPLFFMDYLACGRLDAGTAASIVGGLAAGCRENGCALLGGETAEMPGFYAPGDYDVAGTIVGIVDETLLIDGRGIEPGMQILGLASSGLHTNGYSLARRALFEAGRMLPTDRPSMLGGETVAGSLLKTHRSYLHCLRGIVAARLVHGLCHVTGGGIPGNLCRILPSGCGALLAEDWPVPPVFRLIAETGGIRQTEMRRAFNMGAGMLLVVGPDNVERVQELLAEAGEKPFRAGSVTAGGGIEYSRGVRDD